MIYKKDKPIGSKNDKTKNLEKNFISEERKPLVVNKISLEIKAGEFAAVIGPSGCGKSTWLNLLGLLDSPSGGSYFLMGREITHFSESQRAALRKGNIGFVFQSFNLIDELRIGENVELPLLYMKIPAKERKRKVSEILEKLNIAHRKHLFPRQLAGRQQQRAAFARAVIADPKLILADDPTGNLGGDISAVF